MSKKTLVLGASDNPQRYSYLAMQRLKARGHETVGIGRKATTVDGTAILKEKLPFENIDTITLYLNETHQQEYYDYILSLKPKRIIFNPGTENPELYALAEQNGIEPVEACTLVMLSTNQY
ncbi:CoA-binding protein [Parasegetibacter sp. NRK P23]|uniref:CoA-binding protein n=1 Tax=Parasegetibacter sp. NRK P23 TaxID=2942999 RepID=UPI002043C64F|nr:CoA-binding protein [Parasegetibacter sp. NRK P23]MCM5527496.1 CoA-binding protein [Parasegetibacter sp. NRK P23]